MSRNNKVRRFWLLSAILGFVSPAWSQCPTCWSDRGDRFEGISSQQVSSGLELLGVHYLRAGGINASAPRLHLFFWLPEPVSPQIVVWQPRTNYMMMPKDRRYPKGLQSFSWPRQEVIARLGVNADTLYLRVHDSRDVYFPALLSTSEKPTPAGSYAFILQSAGGIDARCTVEHEVDGRMAPVRSFRVEEEFGGILQIKWDGLDDHGKPVVAGTYALRLQGTLEGEPIGELNYILSFQHYGHFQ